VTLPQQGDGRRPADPGPRAGHHCRLAAGRHRDASPTPPPGPLSASGRGPGGGVRVQMRTGHFPVGRPGAFTATSRFGCLPTLTRATSRRRVVSRIETSSPRTLLTQQYRPSGLNVTQFGPRPTPTRPTTFRLAVSNT